MTRRESQCLHLIREYIRSHGYSPTYRWLADHMGLASLSGVHRVVSSLEGQGRVQRMSRKARSIELVEGNARPVRQYVTADMLRLWLPMVKKDPDQLQGCMCSVLGKMEDGR